MLSKIYIFKCHICDFVLFILIKKNRFLITRDRLWRFCHNCSIWTLIIFSMNPTCHRLQLLRVCWLVIKPSYECITNRWLVLHSRLRWIVWHIWITLMKRKSLQQLVTWWHFSNKDTWLTTQNECSMRLTDVLYNATKYTQLLLAF